MIKMKQLFIVLTGTLCIVSCAIKKEIYFHGKTQPEKEYKYQYIDNYDVSIVFTGPSEALQKLKTTSLAARHSANINYIESMGKLEKDSIIHSTTTFGSMTVKSVLNGKTFEEQDPFSGAIVKGYYNKKDEFKVDTLISDADKIKKKEFIVSMEKHAKSDTLPTKYMKIGDIVEGTEHTKIASSGGSTTISIIIQSSYKLKKIKRDFAVFDIQQSAILDKSLYQPDIELNGKGKGKYIFDLNNSCFTKKESVMNILVNRKAGILNMNQVYNHKSIMDLQIKDLNNN